MGLLTGRSLGCCSLRPTPVGPARDTRPSPPGLRGPAGPRARPGPGAVPASAPGRGQCLAGCPARWAAWTAAPSCQAYSWLPVSVTL
ncbi:hypothetical protein EH183_08785 [Streptomyces sp. CB01881]|nr:hypothetical protein EH183_08785 [Streptomyces sp. CB01881]